MVIFFDNPKHALYADVRTDELLTVAGGGSSSRPVRFPPLSNERIRGPMMVAHCGVLLASASRSYMGENLCCASSPLLHLNRSSAVASKTVVCIPVTILAVTNIRGSRNQFLIYIRDYYEHILRPNVNSLYQTTPLYLLGWRAIQILFTWGSLPINLVTFFNQNLSTMLWLGVYSSFPVWFKLF
jgi:hypothetical protein